MQRVYVALDPETIKALVQLAKANRRHPKHEGGLIITRYLRKRGLLKGDNQLKPSQHNLERTEGP